MKRNWLNSLVFSLLAALCLATALPDAKADDHRSVRPRFDRRLEEHRNEERRLEERRREEDRQNLERERDHRERRELERGERDRRGSDLPHGFETFAQFNIFTRKLQSELIKAGCPEAVVLLQGSAVTGRKYDKETGDWTGPRFDVGRTSDFDIALCSKSLFEKARAEGIEIRDGTRTEPIKTSFLHRKLGLERASHELGNLAGRPVNFMVFDSARSALAKGPGIQLSRGQR